MAKTSGPPEALIVSGDARIQDVLARTGAKVIPAYACRLDGFVDDAFTEYANRSVYRPGAVCRVRQTSTIGTSFHSLADFAGYSGRLEPPSEDMLAEPGRYYLGFTMYTARGHRETIDIWVGHRRVARAQHPDPDNRVHLFVVPRKLPFRLGERILLEAVDSDGPCRIEDLVYLTARPRPTAQALKIVSPCVDLRLVDGKTRASLTWITNRPSFGQLRWGAGRSPGKRVRIPGPQVNHEAILEGLDAEHGASAR